MAKLPWILAAGLLTVAMAPVGCFVVSGDDHDHGYSEATGTASGYGTGSSSGSATPTDACNPVTAAGCPSNGSTCDLSEGTNTFACFPPPNPVDVCGTCDLNQAVYCGAGLTCVTGGESSQGVCYRYCCTDADCGQGASCNTTFGATALSPAIASDVVGLCVQGTGNASEAPSCATASPVSGGSCVGGYMPSQADGGAGGSSAQGSSSSSSSGTLSDAGAQTASSSSGGSGGDGAGGAASSSSGGTGGFSAHPPPPPDGGHAGRGDAGGAP